MSVLAPVVALWIPALAIFALRMLSLHHGWAIPKFDARDPSPGSCLSTVAPPVLEQEDRERSVADRAHVSGAYLNEVMKRRARRAKKRRSRR